MNTKWASLVTKQGSALGSAITQQASSVEAEQNFNQLANDQRAVAIMANLDDKKNRINDEDFYNKGQLQLCIRSAILERDTAKYFGQMDPYVQFLYNDLKYETLSADDRGRFPIWNQTFELAVNSMKDEIIFKIFDRDLQILPDDSIGWVSAKLSSLCINGGGEFDFDIFYDDDICGTLRVLSKYTPHQEMSLNFDTMDIECDIKDKLMTNNFIKAEIEMCKTQIKDTTADIERMEKEIQENEANLAKEALKLTQYKQVYQDYHNQRPEVRADPEQMCKINLNQQSTTVECSQYDKNGGAQRNEWPWMLIKKTNAHYDKWMCQYNKGWIIYTFAKPIIIRGYGLVSASDPAITEGEEYKRDPNCWSFWVKDAILKVEDGKESNNDNWDCVDTQTRVNIDNTKEEPFKEHRFPIKGKQRFVTAIKLRIERNRGDSMLQLNRLDIYS